MANKYDISFYAGDVLEVWFRLNEVDTEAVSEICLSCADLGICVHLPYSTQKGEWCLRLESDFTARLPAKVCYYDLTANLIDGNRVTLIYNGLLTVRRKNNKLCEVN